MKAMKLCVFDLDGTLNQTHLFSVPAHLEALREFGITDKTPEEIMGTFGARAAEYVPYLLGDPNIGPAAQRWYLDLVAENENKFIKIYGKPYDGVMESLQNLKRDGYRTAVCSNASQRYIENCLKELELAPLIDEIQPLLPDMTKADTLSLLLERVKPAAAVMVGDRLFDWEAARANSLPFVGCLYGYNPEEVEKSPYTVAHAGDLYRTVKAALESSPAL